MATTTHGTQKRKASTSPSRICPKINIQKELIEDTEALEIERFIRVNTEAMEIAKSELMENREALEIVMTLWQLKDICRYDDDICREWRELRACGDWTALRLTLYQYQVMKRWMLVDSSPYSSGPHSCGPET